MAEKIKFEAFPTAEVEFLDHLYRVAPTTNDRATALEEMEERFVQAELGLLTAGEEGKKINRADMIEMMAQMLDLRTEPVSGGKKTLGERVRDAWAAGDAPFESITRFFTAVQQIDPFGEPETDEQ